MSRQIIIFFMGIILAGFISWTIYSLLRLSSENIGSSTAGAISAFIGAVIALYVVRKLSHESKNKIKC